MSTPLADWIIEEKRREEKEEAEDLLRWIKDAHKIRDRRIKDAKRRTKGKTS